ncbi:hypothetical protein OQA88_607 [Cercophora sp. LCS_1]
MGQSHSKTPSVVETSSQTGIPTQTDIESKAVSVKKDTASVADSGVGLNESPSETNERPQAATGSPAASVHEEEPTPTMPNIGPEDDIIAVMGLTGVGKSTFISHFSDTAVVGKSLRSCTSTISIHPATIDNRTVYLVDTPGFDDKDRTDVDILREIASWLETAYNADIKLAGVIYLHRILDNRVSGTAAQNIELFKEICGKKGLASVILATTMWDIAPPSVGETREKELVTEHSFWGKLIEHGCGVMRQNNKRASAENIIRAVLSQEPVTLLVQEEIAEGAALHETTAGGVLTAQLDEQKVRYEEEMERLKARHEELQAQMREMEEERRAKEERAEQERELEREEARAERARARQEWEDEKKENARRESAWETLYNDLREQLRDLKDELSSTRQKQEKNEKEQEEWRKQKRWWKDCSVM